MYLDTKEFMAAVTRCTPTLTVDERMKLISRWSGLKNIPENRAKLNSGRVIQLYNDKWDAITDLFNYLEKESGKTVDKSKFMFTQNPAAYVNRAKATDKTITTKTNKAADEDAFATADVKNKQVTDTAYNIAEIAVAIMTQNKILQAILMEMRDLSGYMQDICRELNIEKSPR